MNEGMLVVFYIGIAVGVLFGLVCEFLWPVNK